MLLAGDIGGTKTDLAVFDAEQGPYAPVARATFASAQYARFDLLASEFIAQARLPIDRACFGVAGPVVQGRVMGTNLPWVLDETELRESLGLSFVHLLNDLESIAYSVPLLRPSDLYTLRAGEPEHEGVLAVVAPGTGLGMGYLTWNDMGYRAHPSEGGHADFAPNNALETGLLSFVRERFGGHVSCERVCSGRGIPNIYAYFRDEAGTEEPEWLARAIAQADDPTPVIVSNALHPQEACPLCRQTLYTFVSILGAIAGNLALTMLSTGGLYLAGGIPPRILGALQEPRFLEAFTSKGRLSYVLQRIPVHVVLHSQAGLLGAAGYGLRMAGA